MAPPSRRQVLTAVGAGATGVTGALTGVERGVAPGTVPRSGSLVSRYEPLEEVVVEYMAERNVEAAVLGVLEDVKPERLESQREVVVERAYGWADRRRTRPLDTDARFRIASLTKTVTDAAVHRLVRAGRFDYDDPVLELLAIDPPDGADPRLGDVTVRHCMDHEGGWNRNGSFEPLDSLDFRRMALELGRSRPPGRRELLEYVFARPLDFAPGTDRAYSNVGYAVLGTLIEDVTGERYVDHVRRRVLEPVGADRVVRSRTRPDDRPGDEVWYGDGYPCPSSVDPTSYWPVRCPDGGFYLEAVDAAAGLSATVGDLLAFSDHYDDEGHPRDAGSTTSGGTSSGELPGTYAFAYKSFLPVVDVVIAFNRRADDQDVLFPAVEAAVEAA